MANVTLDLSKFGIEGVGNVTLQNIQETVEGKGIDQFPRNEQERAYVKQVLEQVQTYKKAQTNVPESMRDALSDYEKRIQMEQARIQDPIGTYLSGVKKEAQTGPGLMAGLSEFKNLPPGGQPFDLDKSLEGIINFGQRVLIGDNPKAQFGDIAVIGSDIAAIKLLAKNNSLASQRMDSALISNAVKNNPAYAAGTLTGMNVFARGAANETYDMLNTMTRYLYDIPNPEEAIRKNQQLRDLYDMRNELLWSGGAVGLSNLFPYIKSAWGKKLLGVTEDSQALMKKAEQANVPMNVFSVTESGIVKGSGKVIGLFPFVATKAREVQNAQQVAIANHINKTLNNFSPIGLLNDAGLLSDKAFREGIQNFENTKTILYDQAMDIATTGLKGEKFIPTALIKEEAAKLAARFNRDTSKVMVDFDVRGTGYGSETVSFQDLVSNISSSMKEKKQLYDVLPALSGMKDDYISGEQFISLQTALNDLLREGERLQMGSNVASYVKPFTNAMITSLDDFNNYKVLEDVPKDRLKKEFAAALDLANNFFFENKDTLKGRTGQILSLVDRNITKAGAEAAPGFITADMVAEMLLDSKAMNAPMAIREMKKALGTTKVMIDGTEQTVDVFNTIAKSVLDNKIRKATRYISGSVPAAPGEGLIGGVEKRSIGQMISGAEAATDWGKTKKNFNIPILDVERMQEIFGMGVNGNPNAMAGMKEILGENTFKQLEDVLELAGTVQQTSFGDVSDFVKRRGFLGGANAVTNLITGGMVASNPFGNVGLMLMARYGMSTLADPKFLEGVATILNPNIETLAKRNALITLGRMRWDDIRGEQVDQLPAELLENFDPGNPMDVMQYLLFTDNQSAFPGSERLRIESNDEGRSIGVEITKAESEPIFTEDGQKAGQALAEQEVVMSNDAAPQVREDPFLNVDFESMKETAPATETIGSAPLSQAQRVALAGGDLDEAIAMGSRRA